jgi:hypothetical protein
MTEAMSEYALESDYITEADALTLQQLRVVYRFIQQLVDPAQSAVAWGDSPPHIEEEEGWASRWLESLSPLLLERLENAPHEPDSVHETANVLWR